MPIDPETEFTFYIDAHGSMRLENTDQALEFLDLLDKHKDFQILLGAEPVPPPNLSLYCDFSPPKPNKVIGCMNTGCPIDIKVKLTPLIQYERDQIVQQRIDEQD